MLLQASPAQVARCEPGWNVGTAKNGLGSNTVRRPDLLLLDLQKLTRIIIVSGYILYVGARQSQKQVQMKLKANGGGREAGHKRQQLAS